MKNVWRCLVNLFFRDEVETLFNERDRDRDGSLSFQEFMGQETQMEKAFRMMDKDGDGFVTKTEFKKVCKNLTKEQVEAAFNKFDAAGNGKLNYIEFCDMMNRRKLNQAKQRAKNGSSSSSAVSQNQDEKKWFLIFLTTM